MNAIIEEANTEVLVRNLHEKLDKQQWEKEQEEQSRGKSFNSIYNAICDRIRQEESLETIMDAFQNCESDGERIKFICQMPEIQSISLKSNTSFKNEDEATSCEELFDMLVTDECNASRALEVIQRAVLKTPSHDTNALAMRYMKRGWALLLLEHFDGAHADAKRSLQLYSTPGSMWNAHEILGHCLAKMKEYKQSEVHFIKALDGLRKSKALNEEKAAVAGRVSAVFRMVKEENKPKNKAREAMKKQEEVKRKREKNNIDKKSQGDKLAFEDHETTLSKFKKIPKVAYGKNSKLENASSAVQVGMMGKRGRCVVATKDIRTGSIVMVDQPYASVINADQLRVRCNHCSQRTLSGIPCTSCAVIQYCSDECLSKGAPLHRLECSVMTHLYDPALGKMAPLVFRILDAASWNRLKKSKDKLFAEQAKEYEKEKNNSEDIDNTEMQKWRWNGSYSHKDYLTTFYLVSNSFSRSFGDLFKRSITAVYITHCLKTAGFFGKTSSDSDLEDFEWIASLVLRHLQSSSCNAYEISEMQLPKDPANVGDCQSLEIGGAIYPTISLSNHSCFPNVARYNIGNNCVLRATRFIPKGAEILDNYGFYFHIMPSIERRDALRQQYKFECSCEACLECWPLYPHKQGEPILFKCPSCKCVCSYMEGRNSECIECGAKDIYKQLVQDITKKVNEYHEILALMHERKYELAMKKLIDQQEFFERHASYPAKYYTDIQELLKQCFNCLGNIYAKEKQRQLI